jgi:predicted house-cleaning noncanonical NTP pyrophosphatase (MazG superfamily)
MADKDNIIPFPVHLIGEPASNINELRAKLLQQGGGNIVVMPPNTTFEMDGPLIQLFNVLGAQLKEPNSSHQAPGVTIYNKAVRDKQPDIIRGNGDNPYFITLDDPADWERELSRKLLEEVQEYLQETDPDKKFIELADVFAVLRALANLSHGFSIIEAVEAAKAEVKGAFNDHVYLVTVTRPDE